VLHFRSRRLMEWRTMTGKTAGPTPSSVDFTPVKTLVLATLLCIASLFFLPFVSGAFCQDVASQPQSRSNAPKGTSQDSTILKPHNSNRTQSLRFHGIAVGQPISRLPFQCDNPRGDCGGIVDGNFVNISVWNSTVTSVDVIYKGIFTGTGHLIEVTPPITLAQAVKLHSLQTGARPPTLRYGGGYFFVDLANRISYMAGSTTPSLTPEGIGKNPVYIVSYLNSDAPILEPARNKSLGPVEASLLAEAKSAPLYTAAKPPESLALSAYMRDAGLLYIENVEQAVDVMTDGNIPFESRGDRSKEQFKLVKALDDRIEIHVESKPDKEFYEHGLQRLRDLGQLEAVTFDLTLDLTRFAKLTQNPDDKTKADECLHTTQAKMNSYIRCGMELRTIIKNGEYDPDELVDRCKLPEPEPCDTSGIK
jgi:hypothetical protein